MKNIKNRLLVSKNKHTSFRLENNLKKEQPLYNELVQLLSEANVTLTQHTKFNDKYVYGFTPKQVKNYIQRVKDFYIANSGLTADWLTESEKLDTIKKTDTINRIQQLFKQIKYPLFHISNFLKELYVKEYIYSYVYHPDAIQMTEDVRSCLLLLDKLKVDKVKARKVLSNFLGSINSDDLVSSKIEAMAKVRIDNKLHSSKKRFKQ